MLHAISEQGRGSGATLGKDGLVVKHTKSHNGTKLQDACTRRMNDVDAFAQANESPTLVATDYKAMHCIDVH
jgi:hypothetical protein